MRWKEFDVLLLGVLFFREKARKSTTIPSTRVVSRKRTYSCKAVHISIKPNAKM